MRILVKLFTKYVIRIYALGSVHEKFGVWIKGVPKSIQRRIPGRARRKERVSRSKLKQAFLTDSDAELFMYLIQCIRFGSWKVRRLNRALKVASHFKLWKEKENRTVLRPTFFNIYDIIHPAHWLCPILLSYIFLVGW